MNVGIADDIIAVVEDEKWVSKDGSVERKGCGCKQYAESGNPLPAGNKCFGPGIFCGALPLTGLGGGSGCSLGAAHFVCPIASFRTHPY